MTLPAALATLVAGHVVGRSLLRREVPAEAGEPSGAAWRAVPAAALVLGVVWSIGAVWAGRHAGQDSAWLEALPAAVSGVWSAPLADALALAAVFTLWWHGQRCGQSPPEHESTVRAFGVGALALAVALLWAAGLRPAPASLTPAILLFLAAGLPALSLARLKEVRRDLEANVARGEPARLDAAWWRTLAPPVGAVLGVAVLSAFVLSDAAWRGWILAALGVVGELALAVLYFPILAVGFAAEWLVFLLRRLRRPPSEQEAPPPTPGGTAELLRQLQREYEPPAYLEGLRWVAAALAGALVLGAFLVSSRLARHIKEGDSGGALTRESLSSWRLLLADVRALWRGLLRRLRGRSRALIEALSSTDAGGAPSDIAVRDVREAYRGMLALGRAQAVPRRPYETPDEYLASWKATLPGEGEVSELTAAYNQSRYGPPLGNRATAARLRALLTGISAALAARRTRA